MSKATTHVLNKLTKTAPKRNIFLIKFLALKTAYQQLKNACALFESKCARLEKENALLEQQVLNLRDVVILQAAQNPSAARLTSQASGRQKD